MHSINGAEPTVRITPALLTGHFVDRDPHRSENACRHVDIVGMVVGHS
jgi:hypothetical protein